MKKKILGLVCLAAFVASCGSSGGSSGNAEQAAENSIQGFVNALLTPDCLALLDTGTAGTCNCSGGGTVTVAVAAAASSSAKDTVTAVAASCVDDASGLTYNGTVTIDDVTGAATASFTTFGECSGVSGNLQDVGEACSGQLSGSCAGSTYTCTLEDGPDEECLCQ